MAESNQHPHNRLQEPYQIWMSDKQRRGTQD